MSRLNADQTAPLEAAVPAAVGQARRAGAYTRFLIGLVAGISALAGIVFAVNWLVDPLWYNSGNQLTGRTYPWYERYGKINLYLRDPESYDCLILGSSKAALLDTQKIDGYRCFNFGLSDGSIKEAVEYLRYILRTRRSPFRLVIVGVDGFNLLPPKQVPNHAPGFVKASAPVPGALSVYLSPKILYASVRTLVHVPRWGTYYDRAYKALLVPEGKPVERPTSLVPIDDKNMPVRGFTTDSLPSFHQFREILPKTTRLIGYGPPIFANYTAILRLLGSLDDYLWATYKAAQEFDEYYEFTAPSPWTENPTNMIDYEHFVPKVNDGVIDVMFHGDRRTGLAVHELSWPEFRRRYIAATDHYIRKYGIRLGTGAISAAARERGHRAAEADAAPGAAAKPMERTLSADRGIERP